MSTDVPSGIVFVEPDEIVPTFRIGLYAEPGQGKSVAGCTAPDPIVVMSADRPSAYMYVRKHHGHDGRPDHHFIDPKTGAHVVEGTAGAVAVPAKRIQETRFVDWNSMLAVGRYIKELHGTPEAVRTLVIDPVSNIYDYLVGAAPLQKRKDESDSPDYTWVNQTMMGFIKALRPYDVNLVLIGHVREPKPKKGSREVGMVGPNFGGPSLVEQVMRELDILAHVELRPLPPVDEEDEFEEPRFMCVGQVQTLNTNLICKDGTGSLGGRRIVDLSRWIGLAAAKLGPDVSDLPWSPPKPASSDEPEPDAPPPPDPGTVEMPDLSRTKTRAGAQKKLRDAGCECSDPLAPDNVNCPLIEHGTAGAPSPDPAATTPASPTPTEGAAP